MAEQGPQPTNPTPARARMLGRVRRIGALAGIALLSIHTVCLVVATVVILESTRGDLAADVTLEPLVVPLVAASLGLLLAASLGARWLAGRGARTVANLFDHQDRLMSAVAHEVRTPLSRAFVALDEGASGVLDAREAIDEAQVHATALSMLIDDLLETARVMSGAVSLSDEDVRLDDVVRKAMEGEEIGDPRLDFDTEPVVVAGSAHLLRRAVINLIRNAAVHGYAQGKGVIVVRVGRDGVTVLDDGPGVPEDRLDDIRYETPLARRRGRTGLGLLIAGWVAEAHGGSLVLANRAEGGFAAHLRLPGRGTTEDDVPSAAAWAPARRVRSAAP